MPTIRTTFVPEREIEVTEAEFLDLERQGLVLETKATTDEGARRAAVRKTSEENV